ncbi:MAG: GtrA family protein [Francisellaceae bacterium]|jgi:putative flippase GtrA|nr:GtrA family protein [Francisellaceae bacterium]MBT6207771.1 GtrA family protein [Francisellaceae bacterium]MBT6538905.1 GtrA family protein [Francisellaceae bacterium]
MLRKFNKYVLCGLVATLSHYITMFTLIELVKFHVTLSSTIGYFIGAIVGYSLNARITFTIPSNQTIAFSKYAALATINNFINTGLIFSLTSYTNIHYLICQILVTGIIVLSNFYICNNWIYRTKSC